MRGIEQTIWAKLFQNSFNAFFKVLFEVNEGESSLETQMYTWNKVKKLAAGIEKYWNT